MGSLADLDRSSFPTGQLQERVAASMYGLSGGVWVPIGAGSGGGSGVLAVATPNRSGFNTGQVTVTNHGTAVQFPNVAIPDGFSIFMTFLKANTGTNVYIGNSATNAQTHTTAKIMNTQNAGIRLYVTNANLIFIDADNSSDGVDWIVEK